MLNKSFQPLALALLSLICLTSDAIACRPSDAVCLDQSCSEFDLGTTAIDFDKKNILACLKDDAGQKVWKSMSPKAGIQKCSTAFIDKNALIKKVGGELPLSAFVGGRTNNLSSLLINFPDFTKVPDNWKESTNFPYLWIKCSPDYHRSECTLATGGSDNDVLSLNNGCLVDNEEASASQAALFITCCQ